MARHTRFSLFIISKGRWHDQTLPFEMLRIPLLWRIMRNLIITRLEIENETTAVLYLNIINCKSLIEIFSGFECSKNIFAFITSFFVATQYLWIKQRHDHAPISVFLRISLENYSLIKFHHIELGGLLRASLMIR